MNYYTYVFSTVVPGGFYFSIKEGSHLTEASAKLKHIFGSIAVMSICLFVNSYFKTKAAGYLNSAQLDPLNQGLALMLSSMMSATLFHERMRVTGMIGLAVSFFGLLLIHVL